MLRFYILILGPSKITYEHTYWFCDSVSHKFTVCNLARLDEFDTPDPLNPESLKVKAELAE